MADVQLPTLGLNASQSGQQITRRGPFSIGSRYYVMLERVEVLATTYRLTVNKSTTCTGLAYAEISPLVPSDLGMLSVLEATFAQHQYSGRIYGMFHGRVGGAATDNRIRIAYLDTQNADTWTMLAAQPSLTPPANPLGGFVSPLEGMDLLVNPTSGDITIFMSWGVQLNSVPATVGYRAQYMDYSASGNTWGAQTEIPGQVGFAGDFNTSMAIRSASGRQHLFLYSNVRPLLNFDVHFLGWHISRADGGSWNTLQQIASDIPGNFVSYPFGLGVSYSDGLIVPYMSGDYSNVTGIANMAIKALHAPDQDNPAWTTRTVDAAIAAGNFYIPGQKSGGEDVTRSIAVTQDVPTIFYCVTTAINGSNSQIQGDIRKSAFQGGAWGTPATWATSANLLSGVYAVSDQSALYLRAIAGNGAPPQDSMAHFFGTPPTLCGTLAQPGDAGRKPVPIAPNQFDFCLHREFRQFQNIDYERLGCGKLPNCFRVDEREWGGWE